MSPYKGTIKPLSDISEELGLEIHIPETDASVENIEFKASLNYESKLELPLEKLGVENQINHYGEIILYEDELSDKGFSKANVRFRIMDDCFFVLLRSYIRVDHVAVRLLDTRIFHEFGSNVLFRDFSYKESTYNELKKKGFNFGSAWGLS